MKKYIVIEIQTNTDGTIGNLVSAYDTRNEAESHYHSVLASAAVSTLPVHSAVILTSEGRTICSQCYKHVEEPTAPEYIEFHDTTGEE
jgi:hypothetical protein